MENKKQCSTLVSSGGSWGWLHPVHCHKNATIEHDGKWYCTIHDPEYVAKKNKAHQEKFDAEWKSKRTQWHRELILSNICSGFSTELLENNADKIREFLKTLEVK